MMMMTTTTMMMMMMMMMIDYGELSHEICVFWLMFCISFFESWFISASFEVSQCVLLVHSQKESCCMIRKQGLCVLLESYDRNHFQPHNPPNPVIPVCRPRHRILSTTFWLIALPICVPKMLLETTWQGHCLQSDRFFKKTQRISDCRIPRSSPAVLDWMVFVS